MNALSSKTVPGRQNHKVKSNLCSVKEGTLILRGPLPCIGAGSHPKLAESGYTFDMQKDSRSSSPQLLSSAFSTDQK